MPNSVSIRSARRLPRRGRNENWSETLVFQCQVAKLGKPASEWRFHSLRRWRFDLAFTVQKLAIEIDGGSFVNGRHSRGVGVERDCEKYAEAMILGWTVLRVTPRQVKNGTALSWIQVLLSQNAAKIAERASA